MVPGGVRGLGGLGAGGELQQLRLDVRLQDAYADLVRDGLDIAIRVGANRLTIDPNAGRLPAARGSPV